MKDHKKYDCNDCPYRNPVANFCGCCMKKVVDEIREKRKGEKNDNGSKTDEA